VILPYLAVCAYPGCYSVYSSYNRAAGWTLSEPITPPHSREAALQSTLVLPAAHSLYTWYKALSLALPCIVPSTLRPAFLPRHSLYTTIHSFSLYRSTIPRTSSSTLHFFHTTCQPALHQSALAGLSLLSLSVAALSCSSELVLRLITVIAVATRIHPLKLLEICDPIRTNRKDIWNGFAQKIGMAWSCTEVLPGVMHILRAVCWMMDRLFRFPSTIFSKVTRTLPPPRFVDVLRDLGLTGTTFWVCMLYRNLARGCER